MLLSKRDQNIRESQAMRNTKSFAVLLTVGLASLAQARELESQSYQELYAKADLVVIAKPISTKDTTEQAVLPKIGPPLQVVGLSTEFDIALVMKGDKSLKKLVLHHYRLADPDAEMKMANGPMLASFDPTQGACFLLFLHREADGRYAPVSGQTDPASCSVQKLRGVPRPGEGAY